MKNIILSGSTGFIGSNIKKMLTYNKNIILDTINLRSSTKSIKKTLKNKVYDTFIHAAGPHPHREQLDNKEILMENRQLLEKIESIFQKSEKVILISSFVNLINYKKKKISEDNQIQSYKDDNFYKKSKYETEKFFYELQNKYKNNLIIIYPCHVIGPEDYNISPNVAFFKNVMKKKINYYMDINYPLTDVREISSYIDFIIEKNLNSHNKIIITGSLKMIDYIKKIKTNSKKLILIKVFKFIYAFFVLLNLILKKISILKKSYFPISTYRYIKLNPKVISICNNGYINKYVVDETINDTFNFLKKNNYE